MNFLLAIFDAMISFVRRNPLFCLIVLVLALAAPTVLKGIAVFILYFLLGIFLLSLLLLFMFRWRIHKLGQQMGEQFGGAPRERRAAQPTSEEGEVKVYKTRDTPEKKVSKDVGDYVDFEETKED